MSEPPAKSRRVELSLDDMVKLIKDSESKPKPYLKVLNCLFFFDSFKISFANVLIFLNETV